MITPTTICPGCKLAFGKNRPWQKFCSTKCRDKHNGFERSNYKSRGIPTSTVGAMAELRTAVDLMDKGYEVFRGLSPACSCDLAILKNGSLLRIEVRTGYRHKGRLIYPKISRDLGRSDYYAVCLHSEIVYIPELPMP